MIPLLLQHDIAKGIAGQPYLIHPIGTIRFSFVWAHKGGTQKTAVLQ